MDEAQKRESRSTCQGPHLAIHAAYYDLVTWVGYYRDHVCASDTYRQSYVICTYDGLFCRSIFFVCLRGEPRAAFKIFL
jgi:hypothetical protein